MDYGSSNAIVATPPADESSDSAAPPSHVELATLTVQDNDSSGKSKKAVILHASKETTHALEEAADAVDTAERGSTAEVAFIQAVVDLEKLSHLAHATDDEFVGGLHREANDHAFKPPSRMNFSFRGGATAEHDGHKQKQKEVGDETPLLIKRDVPLEILPFTDVVMDTEQNHLHLDMDMDDMMDDHDGFLLELPKQLGEKEHRFVFALPERPHSQAAADEEGFHRFPMLEKTMSMMSARLPTDIQDVQLEVTAVAAEDKLGEEELHLDLKIKRQVPLIGYLILFFGFFALASAGAAFDLQGPRVSASMKTYWRLTSTVLLIFPIVVMNVSRDGLPKLSNKEWLLLPAAGFCYAQMTTVFVVSLAMTSLANAFVFSNMTSLVIIVAKTLMGLPVLLLEVSGALIGITGGVICSRADESAGTGDDMPEAYPDELLGNLIALSASFGTALYLAISRDLRSKVDLYVYMWSIFFIASFFVLAFMIVAKEPVEFSRHPDYGLFGWMNATPNRLPLELFMAVVINLIGTLGYISVLKYFDSIVVSVVMLMEPVVGVFMGFWVGVASLPVAQTWIGSAIVTFGSGLVVYSGSTKTESIDATKAVRPRSDTIDHGKSKAKNNQTTRVEMRHTPIRMRRPSPKSRVE